MEDRRKNCVKTPSYGHEKRKEMLSSWADAMNCKWSEDENLKKTVFETIKNESKLPTTLNIEQFAIATATKKKFEKDKLLEKINAKPIETAISSCTGKSKEGCLSIKYYFFLFPFISEYFPVNFVKEKYQKLVKEYLKLMKNKLLGSLIEFSNGLRMRQDRYNI